MTLYYSLGISVIVSSFEKGRTPEVTWQKDQTELSQHILRHKIQSTHYKADLLLLGRTGNMVPEHWTKWTALHSKATHTLELTHIMSWLIKPQFIILPQYYWPHRANNHANPKRNILTYAPVPNCSGSIQTPELQEVKTGSACISPRSRKVVFADLSIWIACLPLSSISIVLNFNATDSFCPMQQNNL